MKGFFLFGLCVSPAVLFAQSTADTLRQKEIEVISFTKRLPVAKEIINVEKDLGSKNLGQDLPLLLKNQMSIVATSDAGNGIGYTGFRIRGTQGTSINVMMNGVPYNDSESQGTFFVNVSDLASSASQIVIQRGVGTSSNGVSAFGASVNVVSKNPEESFSTKVAGSFGSFNTYRYSAEVNSGKVWNNRLSFLGRFTKTDSDGYRERAFAYLQSYNLAALFEEGNTRLRFLTFGGKEKTYQAWYGISKEQLAENRRFNPSGAIYNDDWSKVIGYYDNETDNYRQNHYQFLWEQKLSDHWKTEATLHYTKGKGFYENYKQSDKFSKYGLANQTVNGVQLSRTDFIRKKWLDNDFYGIVANAYAKYNAWDINLGAVANHYKGWHFGNVTGVQLTNIHQHEYYRNLSTKDEVSGFAKAIANVGQIEFFADLQLRNIHYKGEILSNDSEGFNLDKQWTFFNPKAGVNFRMPAGKLFLSYAIAHREPNRDDLEANQETSPETLRDWELGIEHQFSDTFALTANAYYMAYRNQLVLTGKVNDVGSAIRENSGKSYRMGIEVGAIAHLAKYLSLSANATLSENKNQSYKVENNGIITDLGDTQISYSPKWIANFLITAKPTKNLTLGLQNQYVGKQFTSNTEDATSQLADYYTADLTAQYRLQLHRTEWDFSFLMNNLFDRHYNSNGYADGSFFPQAGRHFMLGVSVKFQ